MPEICLEIGNKIRFIRNYKGISLEELSEKCGIDPAPLSKLERGETNPTIMTLYRIAQGLNVELAEIIEIHSEYYEEHTDEFLTGEIQKYLRQLDIQQQNDILSFLRALSHWPKLEDQQGKKEGSCN